MRRVIGYLLVLIFGFGAGVMFTSEVSAQSFQLAPAATQAGTSAAYRDGYYLGKHDAEQGRANHIAVGRWNSTQDRAQYEAGYDAGYAASEQD